MTMTPTSFLKETCQWYVPCCLAIPGIPPPLIYHPVVDIRLTLLTSLNWPIQRGVQGYKISWGMKVLWFLDRWLEKGNYVETVWKWMLTNCCLMMPHDVTIWSSLVQIMDWCLTSNMPQLEPMMNHYQPDTSNLPGLTHTEDSLWL